MDRAQRKWIEGRRSQLVGKRAATGISSFKYLWVKDFGHGITVSCDRRRYVRVDESDYKMRYVTLKFSHPDLPDAHASFFEWDAADHPVIGEDFVDVADSRSQEDYEMAAVVQQCWSEEWEHPLDYGSIVVFHRLVISHPMANFWPTMRSAIKREFSRRAAMMLLKAFPLEWENRFQDPEAPGSDDFERRLNAMMRHYQRQLTVTRLPVSSTYGQWMWLPMRFDEEPQQGTEIPSSYRI